MHTVDVVEHLVRRPPVVALAFVVLDRLRRVLDGIVVTALQKKKISLAYLSDVGRAW